MKIDMEREFKIEAGKFVAVGSAEYQQMLEDYRDNMIDCPDDIELGDFRWEFRHELIDELCRTINGQ